MFCAHHARAHEEKLREIAAQIHDETGRLTSVPAVAPDNEV